MTWQLQYRLINLLVPCLLPMAMSVCVISVDGNVSAKLFTDWFLETAFWFFCGPIPFVVDLAALFGLHGNIFIVSTTLRVLTILPFVVYVPTQWAVARTYLGLNAAIMIVFGVLGFLWLILSGV